MSDDPVYCALCNTSVDGAASAAYRPQSGERVLCTSCVADVLVAVGRLVGTAMSGAVVLDKPERRGRERL